MFEQLYPKSKMPEAVRAKVEELSTRVAAPVIGFGACRGRFEAGPPYLVINLDTDGDYGYLCVLDESHQLIACAVRYAARFWWMSFEEMVPYARAWSGPAGRRPRRCARPR